MTLAQKLALAKEMLQSAEANIRSARQIIIELAGDSGKDHFAELAINLNKTQSEAGDRIIEGIFNGQNMVGADEKIYPVPANYASKSKLIPGDVLKLTIKPDGAFVYKQIGPAERRRVTGPLTYEDNQYKVLAEGKAYKVLLASVTYFKAEIGDEVTLLVPALEESEWGAIEHVLPKDEINSE